MTRKKHFTMALLSALVALILGNIAFGSGIGGGGGAVSVPLNLNLGTIATNTDAVDITATFNSLSTTFDAPLFVSCTNTASHSGSHCVDFQIGGATVFSADVDGSVRFNGGNDIGVNGVADPNGNYFLAGSSSWAVVDRGNALFLAKAGGTNKLDINFQGDPAVGTGPTEIGNSTGGVVLGGFETIASYTVSTLPAPAAGTVAYVTDANAACSAGTTPIGGGTTKCFVGYNGSAWKEFGI